MQRYSLFCGLILCACGSWGVLSAETIHEHWKAADVGSGTKPAFDFAPDGIVHVMGMTEESDGVVWHASAASAEGPWAPNIVSTGYFYGPGDIVVDNSGAAHIAFHDHDSQNPRHLVLGDEGAVVMDNNIESDGHDGWDNALAMDRDGGIYMSSVNPSGFGAPDGLEFGSFDGAAWTFDNGIENSGRFMYGFNTAIAIDSAKNPHILYCRSPDWTKPGQLMYATRAVDSWKFAAVVIAGIPGRFPSLAIDANDTLLASWMDIYPENDLKATVNFGMKMKNEDSWRIEPVDDLADVDLAFKGARKSTSIAIDREGSPHIAYSDTGLIKYAHRSGPTGDWTTTTLLADDTFSLQSLVVLRLDPRVDRPVIAFWRQSDEGGMVRLLYLADASGEPAQPFAVTVKRILPAGELQFQWQTVAGQSYSVQWSDELLNWTDIDDSTTAGDGTIKTYSQAVPESNVRYYRVIRRPE